MIADTSNIFCNLYTLLNVYKFTVDCVNSISAENFPRSCKYFDAKKEKERERKKRKSFFFFFFCKGKSKFKKLKMGRLGDSFGLSLHFGSGHDSGFVSWSLHQVFCYHCGDPFTSSVTLSLRLLCLGSISPYLLKTE